jgi:hypothetical protein
MPGFIINSTGGEDRNGPDPKVDVYRSYRWKISQITGGGQDFSKFLSMAMDVTVPSIDFDILQVQGMSLEYKIPKKPTFNNVDITFYDMSGLQTVFEKWTDKIWSPDTGLFQGSAPTDVKGTIVMQLLDNFGKPDRTYTLYGAWPKRISHSKLSMTDESLKTLIVEFVYDFYSVA